MNSDFLRDNYNSLFNDESIKARAFDKIAETYFFGNFGSMSKSDFDVFMFSLLMDQMIERYGNNMQEYSDYKISKMLGVTQTKVSNLKIKKELKYPNNRFDWKQSFLKIVNNATFDNDKIILNIPDPNLFIEIKNAIEEAGGYIEVELNSKLLKVSPRYFVDLMHIVSSQEDKKTIEDNVISILEKTNMISVSSKIKHYL